MALSRPGGKGAGPALPQGGANPVRTAQAARSAAAAWIEQQVSRGTIVSCDPVMCSALVAHGFPAANLDPLRPSTPDPLTSEMIAATAVLRSQFGSRLTSVYAPITLASFGTGSAEVDVRVIASDGSPAYMRQFRADLTARKAYGAQILHNSKIVVAPPARRQLASGMVDSRLLLTISTAAHQGHRLRVVSFGAAAAGRESRSPGALGGYRRRRQRGRARAPPCWTSSAASGWGSARRSCPRAPRSFRLRQGRAPCASSSPRPACSSCWARVIPLSKHPSDDEGPPPCWRPRDEEP